MARASEVLHLAPRSVRDLIYRGRMPSLRIGRLHYVRATDLDLERRRRLGLPLPTREPRVQRERRATAAAHSPRPHGDPAQRRQRAADRAALVERWVARHHPATPAVPFSPALTEVATTCAVCERAIRAGARVLTPTDTEGTLCLTCGRRALLDWGDRRRLEAAAARRMAEHLGEATEQATSARVA